MARVRWARAVGVGLLAALVGSGTALLLTAPAGGSLLTAAWGPPAAPPPRLEELPVAPAPPPPASPALRCGALPASLVQSEGGGPVPYTLAHESADVMLSALAPDGVVLLPPDTPRGRYRAWAGLHWGAWLTVGEGWCRLDDVALVRASGWVHPSPEQGARLRPPLGPIVVTACGEPVPLSDAGRFQAPVPAHCRLVAERADGPLTAVVEAEAGPGLSLDLPPTRLGSLGLRLGVDGDVVVVTRVLEGSPAAEKDVHVGDEVTSIDDVALEPAGVAGVLTGPSGRVVRLGLAKGGRAWEVRVRRVPLGPDGEVLPP